MSDGGLLKKAMDVQQPADEIVAVAAPEAEKNTLIPNSLYIGIGLAVVSIVSMWLYSLPSIQSEYALAIIVPIVLAGGGWFLIWDGVNRKFTEVISVTILLLLASPFISSSLFSSSLTITDSDLSPDAETITLTIRESGGLFGGSSGDADVSITYGGEKVWESVMPLSLNLKDGIGEYGRLTLTISDFYSGNSIEEIKLENKILTPGVPYVVSVDLGGSSDSIQLDTQYLQRTVEDTKNQAIPAMGQGNDCPGGHDNCVVGVGLKAWIGLETSLGNPPSPLAHADFDLSAVLSKDGTNAISYPSVSVVNGEAVWDSMSGEYGSGSASVGDFGSELVLDGSVEDIAINMYYIPRDDWQESDYGCYEFTVTVTQSPPWGDRTAHVSTTYYELTEESADDEAWTEVSGC